MKRLNLGCGADRREGYVNLDANPAVGPDIAHDLNRYPYPFADGVFDEILCDNVLEHLDGIVGPLEEIWRICADGARVKIVVPSFPAPAAAVDPTHRCSYTFGTFAYFTDRSPVPHTTHARYRILRRRLVFSYSLPPFSWLNGLANRLVNCSERVQGAWFYNLSHLYPAQFLEVELQAIKP